jgi:uncharacterized protein involved in exopolysaccharide biosynthesis
LLQAADQNGPEGLLHWSDLWGLFRDNKLLVVLCAIVAMVLSAALAWYLTPTYRAEVVITQSSNGSLNATSAVKSSLGGLASLAGINLPSASGDAAERLAVLKSRDIVAQFIKSQNLVPAILGTRSKNRTMWFAVKRFREKIMAIKEDAHAGLISVTIEWTNPKIAADWANEFVALANDAIRRRDADSATRNISFLSAQAAKTNILEVQKDIYGLIEHETRTLMLANTQTDYAFVIVDPAVIPEQINRPARLEMMVAGTALGLAVGLVVAALLRSRRVHGAN